MTKTNQTLVLRDGRRLGYATYGADTGEAVLYFNGTLGSRLEARVFDAPAQRLGLRVIGVDRPGHGLSDPHPSRSFSSWVDDIRELAEALALERFGVLGLSGGGGHAAVVAAALGSRVSRVALLAAVGPPEAPAKGRAIGVRFAIWLLRWTSLHMRIFGAMLGAGARRWGPRFFAALGRVMPGGDGRALSTPEVQCILAESWAEGVRQGARGAALDLVVQIRPWNVPLNAPTCPVDLWWGLSDTTNPVAIGRWFAGIWPSATLHERKGEGHLLVFNHAEEVLAPFAPAHGG